MATNWRLMVALLFFNVFYSDAQNTTTAIATPAIATPAIATPTPSLPSSTSMVTNTNIVGYITPTATSTVQPTTMTQVTTPRPDSNVTYFKISFKANGNCTKDMEGNLTKGIKKIYENKKFDYKKVTFHSNKQSEGKCLVNITIEFGPELAMTNIVEKFENLDSNSTLGGFKLSELKTDVEVPGVTLGEVFEVVADDCKKTCCNGAGGPISLLKSCTPEHKCKNYKLKKVEPDCMKVCPKECSGTTMKISLMVLLLGVITTWLN